MNKLTAFGIIALLTTPAFAKTKAAKWEPLLEQDDIKIAKFEESAPNGQHNKYNFIVKFTPAKGKEREQALIKDLQEDWLESHTEYSFNDNMLTITIKGIDAVDKGNAVTEQKPFKLSKCFKLNASSTAFTQTKCD